MEGERGSSRDWNSGEPCITDGIKIAVCCRYQIPFIRLRWLSQPWKVRTQLYTLLSVSDFLKKKHLAAYSSLSQHLSVHITPLYLSLSPCCRLFIAECLVLFSQSNFIFLFACARACVCLFLCVLEHLRVYVYIEIQINLYRVHEIVPCWQRLS